MNLLRGTNYLMLKECHRTQRVAHALQRELAYVVQREIDDPRLKFLTIMAVKVSKDLAYADVAITQLSEAIDVKAVLAALKKATPRLRYCLAQRLQWRITPTLRFVYDHSTQKSANLCARIDQVVTEDANKQVG